MSGFIARLSVPFEATVKEIVFARKPDARLFDASYLARFAGEYSLMGQPLAISIKGNALIASMPGQPPLDLVPTLAGDFALKQMQVVTLHFLTTEQGQVDGLEMRQPSTTLTAKRK